MASVWPPEPLVKGAISRLAQLHVGLEHHDAAQLLEHRLDGGVPAPAAQEGHGPGLHLAVGQHAGQADLGDEPGGKWDKIYISIS